MVGEERGRSSMPPYAVGAAVGGGLALLLIGCVLYRHGRNSQEAKDRELRKIEYFAQQAALAEQARRELNEFIQSEKAKTAARKAPKRAEQCRQGGACAFGDVDSSAGGGNKGSEYSFVPVLLLHEADHSSCDDNADDEVSCDSSYESSNLSEFVNNLLESSPSDSNSSSSSCSSSRRSEESSGSNGNDASVT